MPDAPRASPEIRRPLTVEVLIPAATTNIESIRKGFAAILRSGTTEAALRERIGDEQNVLAKEVLLLILQEQIKNATPHVEINLTHA